MKKKTLLVLLIIPLIIGLISFVSVSILMNIVPIDIDGISWNYRSQEGFKISDQGYLLQASPIINDTSKPLANGNDLIWYVSQDQDVASIEEDQDGNFYLLANNEGQVEVTCSNEKRSVSKSFTAIVYEKGTIIINPKLPTSGFYSSNVKQDIGEYDYTDSNTSNQKKKASLQIDVEALGDSTSIDVLIKLYDRHPIIPLLIEYRKYQKLVSSYTSSLARYIQKDGKIHAIFNQALTNTGRLSMSEPNLQNISIRDQEAKEIRKAFYYDDSSISFLSLDYSQIELRVLASLASLEGMIDTFNNNIDIHTSTASKIYHCSIDEVSSSMRRKAKAVNFGIVYGISPWGLAEQLKVSNQEAKEIIDEFYNSYPGLKEFEEKVISYAKENGYVKTILGRRRYIKEIYDDNKFNADFGKRAAVNSVIQGSAADLIKIAMIQIQDFLKDYQTKMVLQIHDELIFKVPKSEVDIIQDKLAYIMEHAMELKCKLLVEGSFGQTWYDCK